MNSKELEKKRDEVVTGFFWLALYIAIIFGLPAVVAAFLGKKINIIYNINWAQFVLLFLAFVFSWGIIAREYKKKTKILRELNEQIKEARNREKIN